MNKEWIVRKWWRCPKRILIFSLGSLLLPFASHALETGDAYVGAFGGYQDGVFVEGNLNVLCYGSGESITEHLTIIL